MRFHHEISFQEFGIQIGAGIYGDFNGSALLIGEDDEYMAADEVRSITIESRRYVRGEWVEHETELSADADTPEARTLFAILSGAMLKSKWFQDEFADALVAERREVAA